MPDGVAGLGLVPPQASPLGQTPEAGVRAQARLKLSQAVKLLIDSLGILREVESEESKAILSALKALAPVTPDVEPGLMRAEVASMLAAASPMAAAPPQGQPGNFLGATPPVPRVAAGLPLGGIRRGPPLIPSGGGL